MLLMLLYQARATYWKHDSFKDDLIIFKINFSPPCKFREHVWWIGERKGSQSGHFLGVSLTVDHGIQLSLQNGKEWKANSSTKPQGGLFSPGFW